VIPSFCVRWAIQKTAAKMGARKYGKHTGKRLCSFAEHRRSTNSFFKRLAEYRRTSVNPLVGSWVRIPPAPTILFFMRDGQNRGYKVRLRVKVAWFIAPLLFSVSFGVTPFQRTLRAQDAKPSPAESAPTPTEQTAPESSPSPTPEPQTAPDLLPESKTLPPLPPDSALPPDLIPERPKPTKNTPLPNPGSAEQREKDSIRFRQIRTIAVRNPFAVYLANRAAQEKTEEGKREYFRAYYTAMAIQMRKLEPKLKPAIDAFEAGNIGRVSQTGIRPTIPLRDLRRFKMEAAAAGSH
jgi:hypothetical protein